MQTACIILYCLLYPVWVYHIFTLSYKRRDYREKMLWNTKCSVCFSLQLLPESSFILRIIQIHILIDVRRSSYKVPTFLSDFNEPWICWHIFEKKKRNLNIKVYQNASIGSRVALCWRTETRDETNSSFWKFSKIA